MIKFVIGLALISEMFISMPVWSWPFTSRCDLSSSDPKPVWVKNPDYSEKDYYVGIGSAEKENLSKDEQRNASQSDAKMHLVQRIQVTIKTEIKQSTLENLQGIHKDSSSNVTVSAEEVLRDLKTKAHWVDPVSCTFYTLMAVSMKSVEQTRVEKLMKIRMEKIKKYLADGVDRENNIDISVRRKYLENAQALLADTDFNMLPQELKKEIYVARANDAIEQINKEYSQVKGRIALFVLNKDGTVNSSIIGKMIDQFKSADSAVDNLKTDCSTEGDCTNHAKERGYSMFAIVNASSQVGAGQMGAVKGTLTISRVVYEIESRKVVKGPDTVSAQVIGWSNEDLDWNLAAQKAIERLK